MSEEMVQGGAPRKMAPFRAGLPWDEKIARGHAPVRGNHHLSRWRTRGGGQPADRILAAADRAVSEDVGRCRLSARRGAGLSLTLGDFIRGSALEHRGERWTASREQPGDGHRNSGGRRCRLTRHCTPLLLREAPVTRAAVKASKRPSGFERGPRLLMGALQAAARGTDGGKARRAPGDVGLINRELPSPTRPRWADPPGACGNAGNSPTSRPAANCRDRRRCRLTRPRRGHGRGGIDCRSRWRRPFVELAIAAAWLLKFWPLSPFALDVTAGSPDTAGCCAVGRPVAAVYGGELLLGAIGGCYSCGLGLAQAGRREAVVDGGEIVVLFLDHRLPPAGLVEVELSSAAAPQGMLRK